MKEIDKHFVSEIDKKLKEFDSTHPKSASQQAESEKYQRIYQLRDVATEVEKQKDDIWK